MDSIDVALANLALQDVPNYTATAKEFNVNRSTLSRRHRGKTAAKASQPPSTSLLSDEQQRGLISYINELSNRGIPPTTTMVRRFAYDISGKMPGKNWVYRFIRSEKNTLQSAYLKGVDLHRKKADNIYQYKLYFNLVCNPFLSIPHTNKAQVKEKIQQYDVLPLNVYNIDKKGFLIGVL